MGHKTVSDDNNHGREVGLAAAGSVSMNIRPPMANVYSIDSPRPPALTDCQQTSWGAGEVLEKDLRVNDKCTSRPLSSIIDRD